MKVFFKSLKLPRALDPLPLRPGRQGQAPKAKKSTDPVRKKPIVQPPRGASFSGGSTQRPAASRLDQAGPGPKSEGAAPLEGIAPAYEQSKRRGVKRTRDDNKDAARANTATHGGPDGADRSGLKQASTGSGPTVEGARQGDTKAGEVGNSNGLEPKGARRGRARGSAKKGARMAKLKGKHKRVDGSGEPVLEDTESEADDADDLPLGKKERTMPSLVCTPYVFVSYSSGGSLLRRGSSLLGRGQIWGMGLSFS